MAPMAPKELPLPGKAPAGCDVPAEEPLKYGLVAGRLLVLNPVKGLDEAAGKAAEGPE